MALPTATADPALPPARCPVCKSGIRLTLASDPGTPVYDCGSTPTRIRCVVPMPEIDTTRNIVAPSIDELQDVRNLAADAMLGDGPITWTSDSRIALGPCGHVTIDGECLAPIDPGRADVTETIGPDGGHDDR